MVTAVREKVAGSSGRAAATLSVAALAVQVMSNTALTGATYDIDGGQQLISR
jgi:hypothetical protein